MGVWQAIELLNTLVDDSDPDVRTISLTFNLLSPVHAHLLVYGDG
jgi:hypothetical protein